MKISKLRKAAKISQRELAKRLGYSHGAIAQVEAGIRRPWPKLLKKLGEFFGVDWKEIR